jgi:hypothetical protein
VFSTVDFACNSIYPLLYEVSVNLKIAEIEDTLAGAQIGCVLLGLSLIEVNNALVEVSDLLTLTCGC